MKTTIEISLYPLRDEFIPEIDDFITRIKSAAFLTVRVNETSTHISGDYDRVMEVVQKEIKTTFGHDGKFVFAMKILKGDLLG